MKEEISLSKAKWLVEPGCVVLVTAGNMEKANFMTFSWQTPVNSQNPCQVLLVINTTRYTYELIKENRQLVINIPDINLLKKVHRAGTVSGRKVDKFKECGLTPVPAKTVAPPLIEECGGHLECRIETIINHGNHDLLICEVARALVKPGLFDGTWIPEKFQTIHYLGGKTYGVIERRIEA